MRSWKLKSAKKLYHSHYVSVFDDRVMLPDGQEITYSRFELKDFVSILPISGDNLVMVKVYRYPANLVSLEIPSGYVEHGESPLMSAVRELEEETGYRARRIKGMGWFHPWTRSVQKAYLFLAQDLEKGVPTLDATEQMSVQPLSLNEAKKKLQSNEIIHPPTIIALQKFLLQAWK